MLFKSIGQLVTISCLVVMCGCAAFAPKHKTADPCDFGTRHLEQALGPEFGKIRVKAKTNRPKHGAHGCALIYTRLAEEDIGDLPPGEGMLMTEIDERLALMLFPSRGAPQFRRIPSSTMAPGPVRLKLKKADIDGDKIPDFVIEESAPVKGSALGYRGLRIMSGAASSGQIIFDQPLRMKTAEGLELTPRWKVVVKAGQRSIVYQGGGKTETFRLDPKSGRFMAVKEAKSMAPKSSEQTKKTPAMPAALTTKNTPAKPAVPKATSSAPPKKKP